MSWIEGTVGELRALARQIDSALGFPRRATRVVGKPRRIPPAWNGRGAAPFGWYLPSRIRAGTGGLFGIELTPEVQAAGVALPPAVERTTEYRDSRPVQREPGDRTIVTIDGGKRAVPERDHAGASARET